MRKWSDPGSGVKHPGSATLVYTVEVIDRLALMRGREKIPVRTH
jgi:hypothetical protein